MHGGLTPYNIRYMKGPTGGATGVFVDLDPLEPLDPLDSIAQRLEDEPLSVPFQAYDLFNAHDSPREYYHDLESFFNILVWYAFCNTLSTDGKMTTKPPGAKYRDRWFSVTWNALCYPDHDSRCYKLRNWRSAFLYDCDYEFEMITESFKDLENSWLRPLWSMFSTAHHYGGTTDLTLDKFMAAIKGSSSV